jgi:aryl-alcohol dehydrogenase
MAGQIANCSRVIAVDVNEERLKLAAELGATHTHQLRLKETDAEEVKAAVMDATNGHGVRHALDTSGQPSAMRSGIECLSPMGTFGMVQIRRPVFGFNATSNLSRAYLTRVALTDCFVVVGCPGRAGSKGRA